MGADTYDGDESRQFEVGRTTATSSCACVPLLDFRHKTPFLPNADKERVDETLFGHSIAGLSQELRMSAGSWVTSEAWRKNAAEQRVGRFIINRPNQRPTYLGLKPKAVGFESFNRAGLMA